MNFCPECGTPLQRRTTSGIARERKWCGGCNAYRHCHPSVMLTCFVSHADKLLWIQRNLEPRRGLWAIPGGFMEQGETLAEGAARELREETGICLPAAALTIYMIGTITFINQVYVSFRVSMDSDWCEAGEEAQAAAFLSRRECPWDRLAYPEVNDAIIRAYEDLEQARFGVYHVEMTEHGYHLDEVLLTP